MLSPRLAVSILGCLAFQLNFTACRSPGDSESTPPPATPKDAKNVDIAGIDTKDLTPRERAEWSAQVSEQLAPCENTPVSLAECINTGRDCAACKPAAEYLLTRVKQGMSRAQLAEAYAQRFTAKGYKEIDVTGSPSRGPSDAAITVVEWADFECPACRHVNPELDKVIEKHPEVRFVFKNFPLDIHPSAEQAARAAVAADLQGKFWEMHHGLFAVEPLTKESIFELAKKIGLDMTKFEKDLRSEAVADAVRRDKKQGDAVDLRGTPTIYINGRLFEFVSDLGKDMEDWFQLELKMKARQSGEAKPTEAKPSEPKPAEPKPSEAKPTEPKPNEPKPNEPKSGSTSPADAKPAQPSAPSAPAPTAPATQLPKAGGSTQGGAREATP